MILSIISDKGLRGLKIIATILSAELKKESKGLNKYFNKSFILSIDFRYSFIIYLTIIVLKTVKHDSFSQLIDNS